MKYRRYFRRNLRRTCYLLFAITFVIFFISGGTKVKCIEYILGKDWARCEIPTTQPEVKALPIHPSDFRPENCAQGFSHLVQKRAKYLHKVYDVHFDMNKVRCFYTPLFREYPDKAKLPYTEKFRLGVSSEFYNRKEMVDEFVFVNCTYKGATIFEDYFSFFPKKRYLRRNLRNNISVLMVGIKGVSRLNLYRTMPETVEYLKRKLGAIDFLKYHKIGSRNLENMTPLLMGLNAREFKRVSREKRVKKVLSPLITYQYMNAGFMTAFAEDCSVNGFFKEDYVFQAKPAHYYWAPYNVALDALSGNIKRGNCSLCLKNKMSYEALLNYARSFAQAMRENVWFYFGFFWTNSLTSTEDPSDGLYLPRLADKGYKKFFKQLHEEKLLSNTILIFLSESGYVNPQFSNINQLAQEEKLPFLFVVLPKIFELRYPIYASNIRNNSKNLVTPFDVHKTLLDLLNLNDLDKRSEVKSYKLREYNLFQELPSARNCRWAGIDSKLCSCAKSFRSAILDLF